MRTHIVVLLLALSLLVGAAGGGAAGLLATQGVSVASGAPGADGADGKDGAAGADGADGAAGAPGAVGSPGPAGALGAPGATGARGATGAAGASGANGSVGATGATGAAGPAGPAGIMPYAIYPFAFTPFLFDSREVQWRVPSERIAGTIDPFSIIERANGCCSSDDPANYDKWLQIAESGLYRITISGYFHPSTDDGHYESNLFVYKPDAVRGSIQSYEIPPWTVEYSNQVRDYGFFENNTITMRLEEGWYFGVNSLPYRAMSLDFDSIVESSDGTLFVEKLD